MFKSNYSKILNFDPLTKLCSLFLVSFFLLFYTTPYTYISILVITVLISFPTIIQTKRSYLPISTILFISLSLSFYHLIMDKGTPLIQYKALTISLEGLNNAIIFSSRLFIVSLATLLFTWTTTLSELAYALRLIHIPYRYIFALNLTIRFVPAMRIEHEYVKTALNIRGCSYRMNVKLVILRLKLLISSLAVRSLYYGQITSTALELRGFGLYSERSIYKKTDINYWLLFAVNICTLLFLLILRWLELNNYFPPIF